MTADPWAAAGDALVGRARELAAIAARWRAAATEGLQVVRIVGEPGVGKSATLRAVTSAVVGSGGQVAQARGDSSAPPLNPIARLVRQIAEGEDVATLVDGLGFDAEPILALAPELRPAGAAAPTAGPVHLDIHRVVDGLRRLLALQTATRPVALLVDDAGNLDVASQAVVRTLAHDRPAAPVLVVLAERDDPDHEPVLGEGAWATVVHLLGLAPDELAAAVARETSFEPNRALLEELAAATGGNPGFALEIVRAGDPARLGQGTPIVSPTAEALARTRVERLARLPGADGVDPRLRAAAVLGDDIDLDVVAAATGSTPGELAALLDRAGTARVVLRTAPSSWRFTAGARSVLAAPVPAAEAAALHAGAADALLARGGGGPDAVLDGGTAARVANHLLAATGPTGPPGPDGVLWTCRAADAARAAGDPGAPVRLLRRANELAAGAPAEHRARIGSRLGTAVWATDGARPARLAFTTAAAAARAASATGGLAADDAAALLAGPAVGYARTVDRAGPPDRTAAQLLDEALDALAAVPAANEWRAATEACRALVAIPGDPRRPELVAAALHHAKEIGAPIPLALAHLARHAEAWSDGADQDRLAAADAAVAAAEAAADPALLLEARRRRHADLLVLGDRPAADVELAAILAGAERTPHAGTAWHVPALRAARAQLDGRLDRAAERMAEARAAAAGSDPGAARAVAVGLTLAAGADDDRWRGLLAEVDDLLDYQPESALWHAARARVLVEQGMVEEARSVVTRFLVDQPGRIPVDAEWLPTIGLLAQSVVALGDGEAAEHLLRTLTPWAGRFVVWSPWGITWGSVDALLGRLGRVAGADDAAGHLQRAVELETALGAPALAARSRSGLAELVPPVEAAGFERVPPRAPAPPTAPAPAAASSPPATSAPPAPPTAAEATATATAEDATTVLVQCFGSFQLEVDGRRVDLSSLTPRLRTLCWFLALNADEVVHAERVVDALWPEADLTSGRRNLQVAVSALRQAVEPGARRGSWVVLAREGDGYRLALGRGRSDLREFELAAAAARRRKDPAEAERALALHGGDLIPEAGPVTWLVERREACDRAAADAALLLAECRLADGDAAGAVAACEQGLAIDRYQDGLWRTLVAAAEANGDRAVAARAQRDYDAVLADLGL